MFFSVVLFGLFHGLVFLPVILSYMGPAAHESAPQSAPASRHKSIDEEKANTNVENTMDSTIKTNKIGVQYKTPKNFVSISEFRALPIVSWLMIYLFSLHPKHITVLNPKFFKERMLFLFRYSLVMFFFSYF